ncbi:response regulator transcription factor [Paenibacillus sp. sgz302251]|uniref:response regulator transcription factor n=1 Tax=Paenibacillus sp. sgz302251 TaxID=3414493 RepID=UPI003C79D1DA
MKILIVDDETGVHDQLRNSVPWSTMGWEIIGDAYDGQEACRLTQELQPDIVISDIKMPLMDGLTFMEALKSINFSGKVIVLSGYGDFEYSRSAFLLDVFDYLLKPLNEMQLLVTLNKAAEQIESESKTRIDQIDQRAVLNKGLLLMHDEFLTSIVSGSIRDENEMFVGADSLSIELLENKFVVIVIQLTDTENIVQQRYGGNRSVFYFIARNILQECLGQESSAILFRNLIKSHEFVLFYPDDSLNSERSMRFVRKANDAMFSCLRTAARFGISSVKQRPKSISDAYLEALTAVESIRINSRQVVVQYSAEQMQESGKRMNKSPQWDNFLRLLESLLETGSLPPNVNLLAKLDEALSDSVLGLMNGQEMKDCISLLLENVAKGFRKPIEPLLAPIHQAKLSLEGWNIQSLRKLLQQIVGYVEEELTADRTLKSGKQLVEIVKEYTIDNYQSVSLEEISQRFYLNKNYFCSLFKSVTGKNFTEFLTEVRMERAKWLLMNTQHRTYQIASLVGYEDQRYFSKVFKKYTGEQPSEFRARNWVNV